ncbi:AMIN-like domain-containing (lipo)protein [Blastococcus sp. PRF04-17]|uniref:AMIN-like domain-containing (lipo)protein n=1 Tax=Blastococcus sp. PRF04-17 TaxID=2933797 RepID=UPI001FF41071|nr:hypothetical protein [Blastococcus sp. PRF04-17]UOY01075.1 hypothetical protein MVA48_19255 [Blastococcus sp. PRF04-17]
MLRRCAVLLSVALLAGGCTQVRQGVAAPSPSATSPSATSPSPTSPSPTQEPDGPTEPPTTEGGGGPAQPGSEDDGSAMRVQGLRFTSDDGSTTLVVNLSSSGVPEWTVGYSDASTPSGRPVDIAGDAFLKLRLKTQSGSDGQGSSKIRVSPGPVAEARTTGVADGYEEVLIGVRDGEQPFRAYALTDPGRIVIEVGGPG